MFLGAVVYAFEVCVFLVVGVVGCGWVLGRASGGGGGPTHSGPVEVADEGLWVWVLVGLDKWVDGWWLCVFGRR